MLWTCKTVCVAHTKRPGGSNMDWNTEPLLGVPSPTSIQTTSQDFRLTVSFNGDNLTSHFLNLYSIFFQFPHLRSSLLSWYCWEAAAPDMSWWSYALDSCDRLRMFNRLLAGQWAVGSPVVDGLAAIEQLAIQSTYIHIHIHIIYIYICRDIINICRYMYICIHIHTYTHIYI